MQFMKCYAQRPDKSQPQGLAYNKFSHQLQTQVINTYLTLRCSKQNNMLFTQKERKVISLGTKNFMAHFNVMENTSTV